MAYFSGSAIEENDAGFRICSIVSQNRVTGQLVCLSVLGGKEHRQIM